MNAWVPLNCGVNFWFPHSNFRNSKSSGSPFPYVVFTIALMDKLATPAVVKFIVQFPSTTG